MEREEEVRQFTTGFMLAVDPDNDGEFSIVELRASMVTLRKHLGQLFTCLCKSWRCQCKSDLNVWQVGLRHCLRKLPYGCCQSISSIGLRTALIIALAQSASTA